jgi:perosamine synthetase
MIPLSVPNISGNEWQYIKECLDTNWVSSVGSFVDKFEKSVADFTGAKYAISTVNGSAALHISLLLADVKAGDFVIVPNITFVASVNTIRYTGANPILIDVAEDNWQMDLTLLESFLKKETKSINATCIHIKTGRRISAIMPVHVLGNLCDMDTLMEISQKYHLKVVEDATEALGSLYKKKHAGTHGLMGCFSFNGNKIITTGGGGMIVTNDETLAKKAKHITTQAKSDPFEYIHDEVGYNYRLVNILAAMGLAQMEQLPSFLERKKEITHQYNVSLAELPGFSTQKITHGVEPNNWLYTIICTRQKELIEALISKQIQVRPFWVPMNQLKMYQEEIYVSTANLSDHIYRHSISLPCSTNIPSEDVELVIKTIKNIL